MTPQMTTRHQSFDEKLPPVSRRVLFLYYMDQEFQYTTNTSHGSGLHLLFVKESRLPSDHAIHFDVFRVYKPPSSPSRKPRPTNHGALRSFPPHLPAMLRTPAEHSARTPLEN